MILKLYQWSELVYEVIRVNKIKLIRLNVVAFNLSNLKAYRQRRQNLVNFQVRMSVHLPDFVNY